MYKRNASSAANREKIGRGCIGYANNQAKCTSLEFCYDEIGKSSYWAANRLNQYAQFAYDPDGNLLSDGIRTFAIGILCKPHTIGF